MKEYAKFIYLVLLSSLILLSSCLDYYRLHLVYFYDEDENVLSMNAIEYGKKVPKPKNIEKEGYTFIDWYTTKEFTKKFDFNTKITEETHIYAKYEIKTYNISFQTNSDSIISDKTLSYGDLLARPEDPVKSGCYIFDDWYTDNTYNTKFDFDTPIKKDYILYAKWNINHQYDEGVITTKVTCVTDGIKTFTCKKCNDKKTEIISATGHEYDNGVITTPANCTNDGIKTFTCKKCDNKRTETIPATGHNYNGITCTLCGNKLLNSIAELNHEYTDDDGLLVTLHSFVHEEINGYNDYSIQYTIQNNIYGSELLAGHFYIIYQLPDGSFEYEYQTGFFNYLYYGDKDSRYYKWRLTSEKTFICLEYIPHSKKISFDSIPNNELLNWIIE